MENLSPNNQSVSFQEQNNAQLNTINIIQSSLLMGGLIVELIFLGCHVI
jgi:hypothetical protein